VDLRRTTRSRMNGISRKPAQTVTELASARQHQEKDHAIPTPNPAGGTFVRIRQREIRDLRHVNSAERKLLPKKRTSAAGVRMGKRPGRAPMCGRFGVCFVNPPTPCRIGKKKSAHQHRKIGRPSRSRAVEGFRGQARLGFSAQPPNRRCQWGNCHVPILYCRFQAIAMIAIKQGATEGVLSAFSEDAAPQPDQDAGITQGARFLCVFPVPSDTSSGGPRPALSGAEGRQARAQP